MMSPVGARSRTSQVRAALFLVVLIAASFAFPNSGLCRPEYRGITILHTNDIHDHLLPFSYPDPQNSSVPYASMAETKNIGGLARLATLARKIGTEVHGGALLLDAGDILDGTAFTLEFKGEADFAALSAAGYDAMVTGNHEFGQTLDQFYKNVSIAQFPVLCANLYRKSSNERALPGYVFYEINSVRIALMGLTTMDVADYKSAKEGFAVRDPFQVAKELVPELRKQADLVVVLSHLGSAEDEKLAKEVPGIDVIVGGHSHARLSQPKVIKHPGAAEAFRLGGTAIVQAFQWAGELGRLDLKLRRDGGPFTLMSASGKLIPITSDIQEDAQTSEVIRGYYRRTSRDYDEVIGKASQTLYNGGEDNPVLNLICDSIRHATGAQGAIYGVGGVRGDILQGPISIWDVAVVVPFHNKLVLLDISGARLKQAFERIPVPPGVSGMTYTLANRKLVDATVGGKPIDDEAVYTVATIDWLVGLYFSDVANPKYLDKTSIDALVDYIKAQKTIAPLRDGRRNIR